VVACDVLHGGETWPMGEKGVALRWAGMGVVRWIYGAAKESEVGG